MEDTAVMVRSRRVDDKDNTAVCGHACSNRGELYEDHYSRMIDYGGRPGAAEDTGHGRCGLWRV